MGTTSKIGGNSLSRKRRRDENVTIGNGGPRLRFLNTFFPGDRDALWHFADFETNFFPIFKNILG
jgi:hypothetical protein